MLLVQVSLMDRNCIGCKILLQSLACIIHSLNTKSSVKPIIVVSAMSRQAARLLSRTPARDPGWHDAPSKNITPRHSTEDI